MILTLDYETRSEADVRKVGAVEYARHPSTEILCVGYMVNDGPALTVKGYESTADWWAALLLHADTVVAHNRIFEYSITKWVLPRMFPELEGIADQLNWKCTAAKAAYHALPRDLERASRVLGLEEVKDTEGGRLLKRYMKPRPQWRAWKHQAERGESFDWEEPKKYLDNPEHLERIYQYCTTDVRVERLLDLALPDLPDTERRIWELNQEMNLRGVQVDVSNCRRILGLIKEHERALNKELFTITNGAVGGASKRDQLLKWVRDTQAVDIPNLQAATVLDWVKALPEGSKARRVLEIRAALSVSSTKKYQAILARAGSDGRVRDLGMYHGDHTGRESGTGIQVKNLPRGSIKDTDQAIELIETYSDLSMLTLAYGDPLKCFSSVIRGMITATPGRRLFVADYNAIECRVVNWIAGELEVLTDFKNGVDLYIKMAGRVGSTDRQYGKTIELACGFGMGPKKLKDTSVAWGVNKGAGISDEESERAVKAYRSSHPRVTALWRNTEWAAIQAFKRPKVKIDVRSTPFTRLHFVYDGRFLKCMLPSGRYLHYHKPEVRMENTPWGGERRPRLYHWHTDSKTKQWVCSPTYGGKLVENIVQATARDLMFEAALKLKENGYHLCFTVHDEIVAEAEHGSIRHFQAVLTTKPPWARTLPLAASGWTGLRYKKA